MIRKQGNGDPVKKKIAVLKIKDLLIVWFPKDCAQITRVSENHYQYKIL